MRSRNLSRRPATVDPAIKFTIFSEGKNTEPGYFNQIDRETPNALVTVQVNGAAGVPKTLGEKALAFRRKHFKRGKHLNSFEENDQVWVVFDRDEHDKVKETIDNLKANKIGVAFTNPCFELWLVLHYEDFDKAIDRHAIQKHLESLCREYKSSHGKRADCKTLMPKIKDAEQRARKMNARRIEEGAAGQPPWTTVYELTEAIRKAATGTRASDTDH